MGEGEALPDQKEGEEERRRRRRGRGGGGHATLINGSKVELSPQPVFVLGAQSVGKEITERESGFIRVAADWTAHPGREVCRSGFYETKVEASHLLLC